MKNNLRIITIASVTLCIIMLAGYAQAAVVSNSSINPGTGPGDPRPISIAAETSLFAAISAITEGVPYGTMNFEAVATDYNNNFTIGSVTFNMTGMKNSDTALNTPTTLAYNTTSGGKNLLRIVPIRNFKTVTIVIDF